MILMRQMMLLMAEDSDDDADGDDDADDAHDANNVYIYIYIYSVYIHTITYIHIMSSPRLAIFTYSTSNNPAEFCRVSSLPGGHLPMMPDAGQI